MCNMSFNVDHSQKKRSFIERRKFGEFSVSSSLFCAASVSKYVRRDSAYFHPLTDGTFALLDRQHVLSLLDRQRLLSLLDRQHLLSLLDRQRYFHYLTDSTFHPLTDSTFTPWQDDNFSLDLPRRTPRYKVLSALATPLTAHAFLLLDMSSHIPGICLYMSDRSAAHCRTAYHDKQYIM